MNLIMQMKKPTIIMAVTNDLVTDQRVDRSCRALTEAGYAVTLVGRRIPDSLPVSDRPYHTARMRLLFRRSALFYAEYNIRLFLRLFFSHAEAFFANDTDTLLACCCAARLRGKKLIFDAHELFPEVPELVGRPRIQSVWRWVERHCLSHVHAAFTVCQSVADEYAARYGVSMSVVRNLPDGNGCKAVNIQTSISSRTILYQGAVNVGRGVREIIDAMQYLPDYKFVVAGNGDLLAELQDYVVHKSWSGRVQFLGRVVPQQLRALTGQAQLGVCLLEDLGLNYRYALPNRIADFVQAGVPMLATDFCEIRRVLEEYQIGTLTEPCPAVKEGEAYDRYVRRLADTIVETMHYWTQLDPEERRRRFARAADDLCWQREKKVLVDKIRAIF